jgi:hypothetical protein
MLTDLAQQVDEKAEEKSEEELNDMVAQVKINKRTQNMAKMLLPSKGPEIASRAHKIILDANEVVQPHVSGCGLPLCHEGCDTLDVCNVSHT